MAARIQNMTEGRPEKLIFSFALPLMVGNVFQQLYTVVDTMVVGKYLGVGALAALDFGRAFVLFHALFFPGKDNWLFDPRADQIINILPQEYFRSCALLILAILVLGCAALVVFDLRRGRPSEKNSCNAPS